MTRLQLLMLPVLAFVKPKVKTKKTWLWRLEGRVIDTQNNKVLFDWRPWNWDVTHNVDTLRKHYAQSGSNGFNREWQYRNFEAVEIPGGLPV